jgi:hypothetical protein
VVSVGEEMRTRKVQGLLQEIGDAAAEEEGLAALQATGWDVQAASRHVKLNRLLRSVCMYRVARFLIAHLGHSYGREWEKIMHVNFYLENQKYAVI